MQGMWIRLHIKLNVSMAFGNTSIEHLLVSHNMRSHVLQCGKSGECSIR